MLDFYEKPGPSFVNDAFESAASDAGRTVAFAENDVMVIAAGQAVPDGYRVRDVCDSTMVVTIAREGSDALARNGSAIQYHKAMNEPSPGQA